MVLGFQKSLYLLSLGTIRLKIPSWQSLLRLTNGCTEYSKNLRKKTWLMVPLAMARNRTLETFKIQPAVIMKGDSAAVGRMPWGCDTRSLSTYVIWLDKIVKMWFHRWNFSRIPGTVYLNRIHVLLHCFYPFLIQNSGICARAWLLYFLDTYHQIQHVEWISCHTVLRCTPTERIQG